MLARVHHRDPIGDLRHHAEIVGDQDQAHARLGLQLLQELEDLRLDGDIERGGRLVGDQHLGAQRQRHRDHHPLALPARELVRVVGGAPLRLPDADPVQQLDRARLRRAPGRRPVRRQRLGDLPADAVHRVQMRERVLEDHRDPAAVDAPARLGGHRQQVLAAIEDPARGDVAGRAVDQVHDRGRRDALAGAALAEDGQHLAAVHVPVDAVHRVHLAARGMEFDGEALDLEQMSGGAHARASATSRRQRCTGSVAMRIQLDRRLRASVVSMIASPGQNASHQAVAR